jgi:N-acyl-D-amino-acid deacylase
VADVTLFVPEHVIDHATYTQPFQYSPGIAYVLVKGTLVLDHGNQTGARPGRALRHRSQQSSVSPSPESR